MRKTTSIHQKQENEHGLPRSIIAMDQGSVNHFCSLEQTANLGIGALERRNSVIRSGRDHSNQCSTRLSAAGTGTNGLSALTRGGSGYGAEEPEKAASPARLLVVCSSPCVP